MTIIKSATLATAINEALNASLAHPIGEIGSGFTAAEESDRATFKALRYKACFEAAWQDGIDYPSDPLPLLPGRSARHYDLGQASSALVLAGPVEGLDSDLPSWL